VTGACWWFALILLSTGEAAWATAADAPMPDARQMKQRMLASMRKSEEALENYSCTVHERNQELNADNQIKKQHSSVKEQFFVNGIQIEHTLEKDGKPLSEADARREQSRVDKEVKKYSDPAQAEKEKVKDEKQVDLFLRALKLSGGRRIQREGRSTLVYDLSGDPDFHPKKLEERFAQALTGTIQIDEETGTPVQGRFETTRDLKIGAGVLANLHKGFWLRFDQQHEPDGAWITKHVEGTGDVRAALFLRDRFHFQQQLDNCHIFSVHTEEKHAKSPVANEAQP
jgi:hypothetical protein